MDSRRVEQIKEQFDVVLQTTEEKIEFWYARDLMYLLGYSRWENFEKAIKRSIESCESSQINPLDHFREVTKLIIAGKGAKRNVKDYMLTRYACYLIAMNGDTSKEEIAFAQSYFAVQTRKQELIEERIAYIERAQARERLKESEKRLSQNIYERGVDDEGFARIRSRGDQALFGGYSTKEMKIKLGIKENRPLADFLPTLTVAAKNLVNCLRQKIAKSSREEQSHKKRGLLKSLVVSLIRIVNRKLNKITENITSIQWFFHECSFILMINKVLCQKRKEVRRCKSTK